MAHLSGFGLENFRVFKEYTWFDFAPITILVGPNSSGKSSLIKALLLLKENKERLDYLDPKKENLHINSFKRLITNQPPTEILSSDVITFRLPFYNNSYDCLLLKYQIDHYSPYSNVPVLVDFDLESSDGNSLKEDIIKKLGSWYPRFDLFKNLFKDDDGKFMPYLDCMLYLPTMKSDKYVEATNTEFQSDVRQSKFLDKWKKKFGISLKEVIINQLTGDKVITINDRLINEVGTGIRQIVSLLLFIGDCFPVSGEELEEMDKYGGYIFIVEEPEANLHPKFQSDLSDLFVESCKIVNAQFIIETHSEYLIRKLQYLTAKGEIKPEDTVIYYFNDPNNIPAGEKQVKKINILEDGSLSDDFGPGFYDEADNLAISLFNLQKSRRN